MGRKGGGFIRDASNRAALTGALTRDAVVSLKKRVGGGWIVSGRIRQELLRQAALCRSLLWIHLQDSPHAHFGLLPLTYELIRSRFTAGSLFTGPHLMQITASVAGGGLF